MMPTYNTRKAFLSLTLSSIALALTACGGGGGDGGTNGGNNGGNNPPPAGTTYSLGGSVSGLAGTGLVLQDGAGHQATVTANGAFTLATGMAAGTSYIVAVKTQPTNPVQACTVTNSSGSLSANVTNVGVLCSTTGYTVGGTLSGLTGTGLVLQNNGVDDLSLTADGSFTFGRPIASGSTYTVTVKTQPSNPAQVCTVSSGTGTVSNGNVGAVAVSCSTKIVSANAQLVAAIGNGVVESLTQVADLVGQRLMYLKANLAPSVAQVCPAFAGLPAGGVTYAFTDNDHDNTLSSGDLVGITFSDCYVPALAGPLDISLNITLNAAPQPVDYQTGFAATLGLISFPLTGERLDGTVDIVFKDSDESRVVQGTVGTGGLSIVVELAGTDDVVTVLSGTATKTVDYVDAKYAVTASADYKSSVLAGRFTVTTPSALKAVLNVYPQEGVEVFRSGSSTLTYTGQNISVNNGALVGLDSDGSGIPASLGTHAWDDSAKGFLWWEPRAGTAFPAASAFGITTIDAWEMRLMVSDPLADPVTHIIGTSVATNVALKLWFSGPVAGIPVMTFTGVGGAVNVPAVVTVNGGFVSVTPSVALAAGQSYQLTTTGGAVPSDWSGPVDPFQLDMTVAP